ncbi:MAG TPA: M17 family metallopeptidase, partial [Chitinophagaceae bacterium]|nr:M17 family metallopeptidase [Chitinophagaceae bacterium]
IDLPPSLLTPPHLGDKAVEIAQKHNLKITVFHEQEVIQKGMGGLAGVSSGSHIDCRFVVMEYKAPEQNAPTLALVGKGITFDSGGLSIKPAESMEDMKDDMSGAAAVIAAMEAIAQLKPTVNVIGLMGLTENLPGTNATKPGDIITFYNGKTAEVKNTDAEGRLILADVLSYAAKHYKPDAIIDVATLTGACAFALGPFYTGLVSQSDAFAHQVLAAAQRAGEKMWRLPMDDDYKKAIETPVADLANIGKGTYKAGWMTAAFFLQPFVDTIPWVHLDIAGTAFNVPDLPYFRPGGGTGAAVRTLIELARTFKK